MSGLSSNVFGKEFVCSEENIRDEAPEYRKTIIQLRKANVYRDELESTIRALQDAGKEDEVKQQQKKLRVLIRATGSYNRFINAYIKCQKVLSWEIQEDAELVPTDVLIISSEVLVLPPVAAQEDTAPDTLRISENLSNTITHESPATQVAPQIPPEMISMPSTTMVSDDTLGNLSEEQTSSENGQPEAPTTALDVWITEQGTGADTSEILNTQDNQNSSDDSGAAETASGSDSSEVLESQDNSANADVVSENPVGDNQSSSESVPAGGSAQ